MALCDRHPGESTGGMAKGQQAGCGGTIWVRSRDDVLLTKVRVIKGRVAPSSPPGQSCRCRRQDHQAVSGELDIHVQPRKLRATEPSRGGFPCAWAVWRSEQGHACGRCPARPRRRRRDTSQPATLSYPDCEKKYLTFDRAGGFFDNRASLLVIFRCHRCRFHTVP